VTEKRIVKIEELNDFAALSYCWGPVNESQISLKKETLDSLSAHNGLLDHWENIPLTIRDAMELCCHMGMPYLWVDALCILQDDQDDLSIQTNYMDVIYSAAQFTIVAATGSSAWSGLPGVRKGSRHVNQCLETISGVSFINTQSPYLDVIHNAVWNTRAWTFQESVLSRRLLIFTEKQLVYKCCNATWYEDVYCDMDEEEDGAGTRLNEYGLPGHQKRPVPRLTMLCSKESSDPTKTSPLSISRYGGPEVIQYPSSSPLAALPAVIPLARKDSWRRNLV
jgi:hypothetical protein